MKKLLLSLLILLGALPAFGTTFYVSIAGNDVRTCMQAQSISTPRRTANAGIACLSGGDTLILRDGVFAERINDGIPSGSAGFPTIIKAENQFGAILRPPLDNYVIALTGNSSYITFDGLDVDGINGAYAAYYFHADTPGQSIHHIRVINGIARNVYGTAPGSGGVLIAFGSHTNVVGHHHLEVSGMEIHHTYPTSALGDGYGLYISCHDSLFENNYIHDTGGWAVHQYTTSGTGINDNIIRNNTFDGSASLTVDGVLISGGQRNLYYNNKIFGSPRRGVLFYASAVDTGFYNNTIYGHASTAIELLSGLGNSGNIIRNNILYGNGSDTIADGGSGTIDSNNLKGTNPQFVNAAAGNFNIPPSSPARAFGVAVTGITTDAAGNSRPNPPAAGALEPTGGAALVTVNPAYGNQGDAALSLAITGSGTAFVNGVTAATFSGAGITVNSTTVASATTATVSITIAGGAAAGARNVTMTTGGEVATKTAGFTIYAPPVPPAGLNTIFEPGITTPGISTPTIGRD